MELERRCRERPDHAVSYSLRNTTTFLLRTSRDFDQMNQTVSAPRTPTNIGIYMKSLQPTAPSYQRTQEVVLEGLQQLNVPQFHFVVFTEAIPPEFKDSSQISYVEIARLSRAEVVAYRWKQLIAGIARRALRVIGAESSAAYKRVTDWAAYHPAYFRQLRELNIRLIWNPTKDVMPAFVPFIRAVWDSNGFIHPMFPEFSYVRDTSNWHESNVRLLERASYVIVGNEQAKKEVTELYSVYSGKVRIVPMPTPTLPPPQCGRNSVRRPYVFYPGRFQPHKNQIVLVYALKSLRDRWGIVLNCVFSGLDDGNLSYVMRAAESLGVREQIEYVGNVSLEELADLYRNAMALVYCSMVGPDNFPPLEAMSVGCPVITAEFPGAREQYCDAAMFFDPTNEAQLAECIKRLLDDAGLRKTLIGNGLQRAAQWTASDYAKAMVKIFDDFALVARAWERCDSEFVLIS